MVLALKLRAARVLVRFMTGISVPLNKALFVAQSRIKSLIPEDSEDPAFGTIYQRDSGQMVSYFIMKC